MPEALESWPVPLFERAAAAPPADHLRDQPALPAPGAATRWPGDVERLARMSIIEEGPPKQVRMAHLATVGSHSVNGVAQLHTDLVKRDLLADFHELWPERFNNKTNGVTPRRWMLYANPRLTHLITVAHRQRLDRQAICGELRQIAQLADDRPFLEALAGGQAGQQARPARRWCGAAPGVELPAEAMFVVQVKRIHEYKRQLLACLQVIAHYLELKRNPDAGRRAARLPLRRQGGAPATPWPSCTSS